MNKIHPSVKVAATFFGLGYLPLAPGTLASIAGLLVFALIGNISAAYLSVTALLVILGFAVCGRAERGSGKKDPHCIVIDEVAGMLVALLFLPYNLTVGILAFILFRTFDIIKPYPIYRLERLSGSLGIMLDDIMAGLYTNIVLQAVLRLVFFSTS